MVSLNRKDKWGPWIVEIRRKNKHILFTRVQRIVSKTQGFFFFFKAAEHIVENPCNFTCCDEDSNTVLSQLAFSGSFTPSHSL